MFVALYKKKGRTQCAESSRSVRGLGKGVSGKPYLRMCNARRPRLEPGTFRSQAVRLYRLHQARPSLKLRNIQDICYRVQIYRFILLKLRNIQDICYGVQIVMS